MENLKLKNGTRLKVFMDVNDDTDFIDFECVGEYCSDTYRIRAKTTDGFLLTLHMETLLEKWDSYMLSVNGWDKSYYETKKDPEDDRKIHPAEDTLREIQKKIGDYFNA